MPRQSRSSRPAARPSAPAPSAQQSRGAHTAAAPAGYGAQQPHAPVGAAAGQQRQPGMLASMASTMGSVAAGSVVGHGISNMLFGGSNHAAAPPPPADLPAQQQQAPVNYGQQQAGGASCSIEARDFTKCLDATNDMQSCSYYLEALKACQAAARQY